MLPRGRSVLGWHNGLVGSEVAATGGEIEAVELHGDTVGGGGDGDAGVEQGRDVRTRHLREGLGGGLGEGVGVVGARDAGPAHETTMEGVVTDAILGAVADPHCGRDSNAYMHFAVGSYEWEVQWGRFDAFGTAAYWIDQTVRSDYEDRIATLAGVADLLSETLFCLLGGFGVTAESALAAHSVVIGLLASQPMPTVERFEDALRDPLPGGLGRYRFPRQRAFRVANAVTRFQTDPPDRRDPLRLREYLLSLNGIGPKTAAWIVRNVTGSGEIAIIDIWLIRALTRARIFRTEWRVEQNYDRFEDAFLQYAKQGNVSPAALDLCIWEQARGVGHAFFATR